MFKRNSLTTDILVPTVATILFITTAFASVSLYRFNNFITEQFLINSRNASKLIADAVEGAARSMNHTTEAMAKNKVLIKALSSCDMAYANAILTGLHKHLEGAENVFVCEVTDLKGFKVLASSMLGIEGFTFAESGDYHENVMATLNNRTAISYPSQSPVNHTTVLLSTTPFKVPNSNKLYAMCFARFLDAEIQDIINSYKIGKEGYAFVMRTSDGMMIAHPDSTMNWNLNADKLQLPASVFEAASHLKPIKYMFKNEDKVLIPYVNSGLGFAAFGSYKMSELKSYLFQVMRLNFGSALVMCLLISFIVRIVFKRKFQPLFDSERILSAMSEGDLTNRLDNIKGNNEISRLSRSLNKTMDVVEQLINHTVESIDQLKTSSHELSKASSVISDGASMQAANVEEVATSIEEINATVEQNSQNAMGNQELVTAINKEITVLDVSSEQVVDQAKVIAGFLSSIADLANQIKLLSLNAAIEAAKAGEYGRGFSVIAAEVRKLSENSQELTYSMSENSIALLDKASETKIACERIIPMLQNNSESTSEIYLASQEQKTSMGQISCAINELNRITQTNTCTAEELNANAEELSEQTEQLSEMVSFFRAKQGGNDLDLKKTITKTVQVEIEENGGKLDSNIGEISVVDSIFMDGKGAAQDYESF